MKNKIESFLLISLIVTLSSCCTNYFQIYEVKGLNINSKSNYLVFEDENCKISYNFWSEGGDAGFIFENKTESDIVLDLSKSFYVNNDFTNDYYLNRSDFDNQSPSTYLLKSTSIANNSKHEVCIVAKSSRIISEYAINLSVLTFDDYSITPNRKTKEKYFTQSNTPISFKNIIQYRINGETHKIINNFYIISLLNISARKEFVPDTNYYFDRDNYLYKTIKVMKHYAPNRFFLKYVYDPYEVN